MRLLCLLSLVPPLAVGFAGLRRLAGSHPGRRRVWSTDLAFWLLHGTFTRGLLRVATIVALVPFALLIGLELDPQVIAGFGPLATLPRAMQLVLALLVIDLLSYGFHRLHHRWRPLWTIHRVHHSSTHLDWLASTRIHPLNGITQRIPVLLLTFLTGLDLTVLAAAHGLLALLGVLIHEDVDWRLGPLSRVFVTPAFHRWHHAEVDGGCNFGGLLVIWDRLFGTFHLPEGQPETFGVPMGRGFFGLLALRPPLEDALVGSGAGGVGAPGGGGAPHVALEGAREGGLGAVAGGLRGIRDRGPCGQTTSGDGHAPVQQPGTG